MVILAHFHALSSFVFGCGIGDGEQEPPCHSGTTSPVLVRISICFSLFEFVDIFVRNATSQLLELLRSRTWQEAPRVKKTSLLRSRLRVQVQDRTSSMWLQVELGNRANRKPFPLVKYRVVRRTDKEVRLTANRWCYVSTQVLNLIAVKFVLRSGLSKSNLILFTEDQIIIVLKTGKLYFRHPLTETSS